MKIQTNIAIRITPPSKLNKFRWLVENYENKQRYSFTNAAIYILLYLILPNDLDNATKNIASKLEMNVDNIKRFIENLIEKKLILDPPDNVLSLQDLRESWIKRGWIEAFEYHFSTYNYNFIGADEDGRIEARKRMHEYSLYERDIQRSKNYTKSLKTIPLSLPTKNTMSIPVSEVWEHSNQSTLNKENLINIVSLTFGKVNQVNPNWDGEPLIQKTSPSGGARHPSEGYIIVNNVHGLNKGIYSYSVDQPSLELIDNSVRTKKIQELFPLIYQKANFDVSAIIIITSVFERNMYRYREPRTFRTVHMDAGHLCGTIEILANSLGLNTFVQYGGYDSEIESMLRINGLQEGYQLSVALG